MSDTFDHEGDAWESEADREIDYLLFGNGGRASRQKFLSCKGCGSIDVYWSETVNGWRLINMDTGLVHNCRHEPASSDDFEVVSPGAGS